jgi:hypothetical protein
MADQPDHRQDALRDARVRATVEFLRWLLSRDPPQTLERVIASLRLAARDGILDPHDALATLGYTATRELGWEEWEHRLRDAGFDPVEIERMTRLARRI